MDPWPRSTAWARSSPRCGSRWGCRWTSSPSGARATSRPSSISRAGSRRRRSRRSSRSRARSAFVSARCSTTTRSSGRSSPAPARRRPSPGCATSRPRGRRRARLLLARGGQGGAPHGAVHHRRAPGRRATSSPTHEGEEFIYVLEGAIEVEYGKDLYTLDAGRQHLLRLDRAAPGARRLAVARAHPRRRLRAVLGGAR